MTTHTIDRNDLEHYLDHFSGIMPTELVEIEVAGLDLGDQVEAEWVPLSGISYDPRDDVVVIDLNDGALQHMVRQPREFVVEEDNAGIHSFSIRDNDGRLHLVKLKEPRELPEPS